MSENFTEILLIKMKSARDRGDWQGEKDWIPDTSSPSPPPPQIFLFFWDIPLSAIIKRATVSDYGISTSGEGRDFSEIIAAFLVRNKRVYAMVASWGREGMQGRCWVFSPSSHNMLFKLQAG